MKERERKKERPSSNCESEQYIILLLCVRTISSAALPTCACAFHAVWIFPEVQTGQFVAHVKRALYYVCHKRTRRLAKNRESKIARVRMQARALVPIFADNCLFSRYCSPTQRRQKLSSLLNNVQQSILSSRTRFCCIRESDHSVLN